MSSQGNVPNPHNPEFLTKVPWYLGESGPTLDHHSIQKDDHVLSLAETDALINAKIKARTEIERSNDSRVGVYKKGACKNCGSTTHVEKDCVERPRSSKKSAWKSGIDIKGPDVSLNFADYGKISYAGKRDQWKGYDPSAHKDVVNRFQQIEDERLAKIKEQQELAKLNPVSKEAKDKDDSDSDSSSDEDETGFSQKDEQARDFQGRIARQGGVGGAQMMVTVRNLRVREDTPKYLRNLNLESAHYDPKSRSMRSNPNPDVDPNLLDYAGDNFVRNSGDAGKLLQNEVMCWDMQATKSADAIDLLANPSLAEIEVKRYKEQLELENAKKKRFIEETYGINNSVSALADPRLRLGQTEVFQQYTKEGRLVNSSGENAKSVRKPAKYEEDVYSNGHHSVWGSYYCKHTHKWGYACCHSTMYSSYCTGEVGRAANDALSVGASLDLTTRAKKLIEEESKAKEKDLLAVKGASGEDRKRSKPTPSYNGVTEEEMEEYRLKRLKGDDPMANYVDSEV